MRAIFLCLILCMSLADPLFAALDKHSSDPTRCSLDEIKEIKKDSSKIGKWINVKLDVVASGQTSTKSYRVLYGSTAADVLKLDHKVENGVVCCRPDDIKSVDGHDTNFTERHFWMVSINDSTKVSPNNTLLNDGDHVIWKYLEGDK